MRKSLAVVPVVMLALAGFGAEYHEVVDGVTWRYLVKDNTAWVGSEMTDGNGALLPAIPLTAEGAVTIPVKLGGYPVVGICARAFWDHDGITSVEIPAAVVEIGREAFAECDNLGSVNVPGGVVVIGEAAFRGCGSVSVATLDGNRRVDEMYPDSCSSITNAVIREGSSEICTNMFRGCTNLVSVTIPEGVIAAGDGAFAGCSRLADVKLPQSLVLIGAESFEDCAALEAVVIPGRVTSVGDRAFEGCIALGTVTIPESVTAIGTNAFANCTNLTTVYVHKGDADRVRQLLVDAGTDVSGLTFVDIVPTVIRFDANGGSCVETNRYVDYTTSIGALPAAARAGCLLSGWYTAADGGRRVQSTEAFAEDLTLYARWLTVGKSVFVVHFEGNGAVGTMNDMSCTYGQVHRLPVCTFYNSKKKFVGWTCAETGRRYDDGTLVFNLVVEADSHEVTLKAVWE